mgnify:CR=1 FL=1
MVFIADALLLMSWARLATSALAGGAFYVRARRRARAAPMDDAAVTAALAELAVVMPAFNEADQIEQSIEALRQAGPQLRESVVVDDGSTDATAALAEAALGRCAPSV